MLTTLPESRAPRARRLGGTVASLLVHATLVITAVALTTADRAGATVAPPDPIDPIIYTLPRAERDGIGDWPHPRVTYRETQRPPTHVVTSVVPPSIPEIDIGRPLVDHADMRIASHDHATMLTSGSVSGMPGSAPGAGSVIGEDEVERAPRMIGARPALRYPDALRGAGIGGRVVLEFVVDTAGRAEPGSATVVESTRPEFADVVRRALPLFLFAPGEHAGRRVRTRVQLPFEFRLDGR